MKKKIIYGILSFIFGIFFGGIFSFCSAGTTTISGTYFNNSVNSKSLSSIYFTIPYSSFISSSISNFGECTFTNISNSDLISSIKLWSKLIDVSQTSFGNMSNSNGIWSVSNNNLSDNVSYVQVYFYFTSAPGSLSFDYTCTFSGNNIIDSSSSSSSSSINVLYNNENSSETIVCDGDNIIQIDGLSTITATNKFTPYFNIYYTDEDNQKLTESYSNSILYLENGKFKKTYTGNNERILSVQENQNTIFTGYTPVFDVTGTTDTLNTGNVFNNWSDNALKVLLSNVPGYIQYITIFAILLFLFSFLMRFKRKR